MTTTMIIGSEERRRRLPDQMEGYRETSALDSRTFVNLNLRTFAKIVALYGHGSHIIDKRHILYRASRTYQAKVEVCPRRNFKASRDDAIRIQTRDIFASGTTRIR